MSISMIKYKASRFVSDYRFVLLPIFLIIQLVTLVFTSGSSFIAAILSMVLLCIEFGAIMACFKIIKNKEVDIMRDSFIGLTQIKTLFPTYILYDIYVFIGGMLASMLAIGVAATLFGNELVQYYEYLETIDPLMLDTIDPFMQIPNMNALVGAFVVILVIIGLFMFIVKIRYEGIKYAAVYGYNGTNATAYCKLKMKGHYFDYVKLHLAYIPRLFATILLIIAVSVPIMFLPEQMIMFVEFVACMVIYCIFYRMNFTMAKCLFFKELYEESYESTEYYNDSIHQSIDDIKDAYIEVEEKMNDGNDDYEPISDKKLLIGLALYLPFYLVFGNYIMSYLFMLLPFNFNDSLTLNAYYNLFADSMFLIVGYICFKELFKDLFKRFKKAFQNKNKILVILKGVGLVYLVNFCSSLIVQLIIQSGDSSQNQEVIEKMLIKVPLPMIITVVFIAPILEEIIFRGIIYRAFARYKPWLGHIISGFAFGFVHVANAVLVNHNMIELIQMLPYVGMGICFSYFYEKHKTISMPIMFHMLNNLFSVIIILMMMAV